MEQRHKEENFLTEDKNMNKYTYKIALITLSTCSMVTAFPPVEKTYHTTTPLQLGVYCIVGAVYYLLLKFI
jgi:hypothetical protein